MRLWISFLALITPWLLQAADIVHPMPAAPGNGRDAMMANSPFTVYTAGAVGYVLITVVLILTLLVGAFLVVNLGMMSRRERDMKYKTTPEPSDLGILKGERFGRVREERPEIQAETKPEKLEGEEQRKRGHAA